MTNTLSLRAVYTVLFFQLCLKECLSLYFNKTSYIQIRPLNISRGFTLTFRTCKGGTLFEQNGTNSDSFGLFVVPGSVNYTSQKFTPSFLVLKWRISSKEHIVYVGKELDQNKPYEVVFSAGSGNTMLSVGIGNPKSIAHVSSSILDIKTSGYMILGHGFAGCIQFGDKFDVQNSLANDSIIAGCPLDLKPSCERQKCPIGYKGYYCEENMDDCASHPCHHASTCVDKVANYTCVCGLGWEGRNCEKLKDKKLCDYKPCQNDGICKHVDDFNNYTCSCRDPYSGRNCTLILDPCGSNPCARNGTCKNISSSDFQCDCPQGFRGKRCQMNIDACATADCGGGKCIDGIQNYSCNCTDTGFTGDSCQNDVNECDQSPCVNSSCTNYAGGYKCTCSKGYSGKNCETNIDDCAPGPCQNNGNCTDLLNDFQCHCLSGFSGKSCETKLHLCNVEKNCTSCASNPCQHGVCNCTCEPLQMFYTCTCDQGYQGENCSQDINECTNSSLCYNNSTCINTEGGFYCKCPEDFTGRFCNESRSICHPNPCAHGKCFNLSVDSYNCSCSEGWKGQNCSEDVNECALLTDKCNRTRGTCRNTNGSYLCDCKMGYEGIHCNGDVDECDSNPCKNDGRCENTLGSFKCFCANGFTGRYCSVDVDECTQLDGNEKCKNGTCIDKKGCFECKCFPGWKGKHCDEDIDECELGFCKNNASCTNGLGNYSCTCQAGYTDFNCSTNIDECESGPCQNNGTCSDKVNSYECSCSGGYEGTTCEFDINWCNTTRHNGSDPCIDGICLDGLLNYTCSCFAGFTGRNCETDIDECADDPCSNGAICVQKSNATAVRAYFGREPAYPRNESGGYLCACKPGFNGTNCETNIDECKLYNPCNATGTERCIDAINDYNCSCKTGFKGRNCSEDVNECLSSPCLNNGTCQNLPGLFVCICESNYTGRRCERRVDPCTALSPCENGGRCIVIGDFNYTCSCTEGYAGKTCSNVTTLGFDGTTSMRVNINASALVNISFSFQTIFSDGVLVSESTIWMMALRSGYLQVLSGTSVLFILGSRGTFIDSRWHSVSVLVNRTYIFAKIGSENCTRCSNQSEIHSRQRRAVSPSSGTQLLVGVAPGDSTQTNFVGSIRDFSVNGEQYYPGVPGVIAENFIQGFQRQNVCSPSPCVNGVCKDLWTKYTCECDRNWTSTNCSEVVQWGTFGATFQLNNGYIPEGNQSFAKYLVSSSFTSLVFAMRTRSPSSIVVLLALNASVYISVETSNGSLQLTYRYGESSYVKNTGIRVDNASEHYMNVNRSAVQIDGVSVDVTLPSLNIEEVFVGAVSGVYGGALFGSMTQFRGCIRDVRLNGKQLLFFNQTASHLNSTQRNIAVGCSSEDICGNLTGNNPCFRNGTCIDHWNSYTCRCRWPFGGVKCELYGCQWTNPCPGGETCLNVPGKPEFECLTTATFNNLQSTVLFANASSLSLVRSLVVQFRTRQNTSGLLVSVHNHTFFEIFLKEGRLVVSYNLGGNDTGTLNIDVFVSDGNWHELRVKSNENQTIFDISSMALHEPHREYLSNSSFVRNISVLNMAFPHLVSSAGIRLGSSSLRSKSNFVGCLREIRIGGHLLSFARNGTLESRPGFRRATSLFSDRHLNDISNGCHGHQVCNSTICGGGTCQDLWNDFNCSCPKNYFGRFCHLNSCSSDPCNNGTCTLDNETGFKCSCLHGYSGTLCDEPCPCKNGGKCDPSGKCECAPGWSGRHCEDAKPQETEDDDNLPLIIGLSVAGGVLVLVIIAVIFFCTRQTSSTFGTYSPSGEEKVGARVEMSPVLNLPPPEKLI